MDNLEEASLISESDDNATCFVVGDALGALDGSTLLFQAGHTVQLGLEEGNSQQGLETASSSLVALNQSDTDSESLDQNVYLKRDIGNKTKNRALLKRKFLIERKQDMSMSDSTDLDYNLGLEDDQGTPFSILHFEGSNDAQDSVSFSGTVKHSLLADEDDLTRSSLGGHQSPAVDQLIDPDDPIPVREDVDDENCNDDENEFFNSHDDECDNTSYDLDEEEEGLTLHLKINHTPRRRQVKAGKTKTYSCPEQGCSKIYTALHHLKVHSRTHSGDRPFLCTESSCSKRFGTNYALKAHIRTHTGEKPYLCPEESCGKGFKTSGDLQKHIRTHTGERPFKCNVPGCDRSFTTSNIRKVHVRTHTGERPYECTEPGCGRAFASATNFKNHMRIHSGEKPYVCTVKMCGRRFTEYSSLYKHQTVHTQQKPYECKDCGRNYRQSSTLTMHRRTAHGIIQTTDGTEIMLQFPPVPPDKIESYMFLELSETNSTVVQFNSNQILESIETSTPSPSLPVRAENDSDDEDVVITPSISIDDEDSSLKQIFVVSDDGDISAYDESFEPLDSSVV